MKTKRKQKKKPFIPLPDFRNTERGKKWLAGMIEASESKRSTEDLLEAMQAPLLREREPGDDDN